MLVASDEITQKSWEAVSRGKGDAFMIAGATLYGFSKSFAFYSNFLCKPDIIF